MDESVIIANSFVLIRLPSSTLRVVKMVPNTTIHLGKFGSFFADEIIGKLYGYTYEIRDDKHVDTIYSSEGLFSSSVVNADGDVGEDEDQEEGESMEENGNEEKTPEKELEINTNETTTDDPTVQKLSMSDIEQLKKTEKGERIIQEMIKSHGAFEKKSIYSREKYTRRKQAKFLRRFTPCFLGSSELIEYYMYKDQHRILDMTSESLGLILSLANVHEGGNYIVFDETGGLIAGAMLERMGNEGTILFVHENEHANMDVMKFMNFDVEQTNRMVKTINILQLFHPEEEEVVRTLSPEYLQNMKSSRRGQYYRKLERKGELDTIFKQLNNSDYDGLIMATTLETKLLLDKLIPALAGSRQLVIYNVSKEPLVETVHDLMADLRVIAPTMLETRVRKYQVFPGRTHPMMTSRSGGGFLVWGTRVLPSAVQAGGKRRRKN
ncbi:Gcd10p family-domain-containing protein [Lipomyces oligophaga]|uniref:Gcd10p family-domain-containing protein n=1 Tax=Lipomyces oligophaga TaxID=45792 RepID=UPI0034CE9D9A